MRAFHHPARPLLLAALVTAGALALATAAAAAVGSWSPLGPDGDSIYGLATDPANPDLVYAATTASVFRSSDGGESWTFAGTGLDSTSIRALVLSGSAVIVGTHWEGVWRSLDEGRTWRVTTAGFSTRPLVHALVVDPRRSERVCWRAGRGSSSATTAARPGRFATATCRSLPEASCRWPSTPPTASSTRAR